ncbi:unnamed protein product [Discula destructiva]
MPHKKASAKAPDKATPKEGVDSTPTATPTNNSPMASSAGAMAPTDIDVYHIPFPDAFLDIDKDVEMLPVVPDLCEDPEKLTVEARTRLAATTSTCWHYDLPLSFGHFPMNEILDKDKNPLRLPLVGPTSLCRVQIPATHRS